MNVKEAIMSAVAAHSMWKARLRTAVRAGSSDFRVDTVRRDDQCEFGRWLGQISDPKITKSEDYKKCTELHRQFHLATAKVLALATSGQKAMAEKALGLESEFATTSARLTAAMMHWSRSS